MNRWSGIRKQRVAVVLTCGGCCHSKPAVKDIGVRVSSLIADKFRIFSMVMLEGSTAGEPDILPFIRLRPHVDLQRRSRFRSRSFAAQHHQNANKEHFADGLSYRVIVRLIEPYTATPSEGGTATLPGRRLVKARILVDITAPTANRNSARTNRCALVTQGNCAKNVLVARRIRRCGAWMIPLC
jgi:hypothetical protein